jgi:hypothetical protein
MVCVASRIFVLWQVLLREMLQQSSSLYPCQGSRSQVALAQNRFNRHCTILLHAVVAGCHRVRGRRASEINGHGWSWREGQIRQWRSSCRLSKGRKLILSVDDVPHKVLTDVLVMRKIILWFAGITRIFMIRPSDSRADRVQKVGKSTVTEWPQLPRLLGCSQYEC